MNHCFSPGEVLGTLNAVSLDGYNAEAAEIAMRRADDPSFETPEYFKTLLYVRRNQQPEEMKRSLTYHVFQRACKSALTGWH